jgi:hypothetical protein
VLIELSLIIDFQGQNTAFTAAKPASFCHFDYLSLCPSVTISWATIYLTPSVTTTATTTVATASAY